MLTIKYRQDSLPLSSVVLVSGSPSAEVISDFVVLFLTIFDCRLCDVSFLRLWFPVEEHPESRKVIVKNKDIINLFIYSLILNFI